MRCAARSIQLNTSSECCTTARTGRSDEGGISRARQRAARPEFADTVRRTRSVSACSVAESAGSRAYRARSVACTIRASAAASSGLSRNDRVSLLPRARGDSLADQATL